MHVGAHIPSLVTLCTLWWSQQRHNKIVDKIVFPMQQQQVRVQTAPLSRSEKFPSSARHSIIIIRARAQSLYIKNVKWAAHSSYHLRRQAKLPAHFFFGAGGFAEIIVVPFFGPPNSPPKIPPPLSFFSVGADALTVPDLTVPALTVVVPALTVVVPRPVPASLEAASLAALAASTALRSDARCGQGVGVNGWVGG
jgi:hypothetical protein